MGSREDARKSVDWLARRTTWIWLIAAFVVLVFGYLLDPIDVLREVALNQALSDEQTEAVALAAGFTLPVVVGAATLVLLYGRSPLAEQDGPWQLLAWAGVFGASGLLSRGLGLGLAPSLDIQAVSGPVYVSIPALVFKGYLRSYGFRCSCVVSLSGLPSEPSCTHGWVPKPSRS